MSTTFTGSYLIPAPRQRVWEALNDPEILAKAIPGCESLTEEEPRTFRARVTLKIGVVSAAFDGRVVLDPVSPPARFDLRGEASGGLAGFAKGGAEITLDAISEKETRLDYHATADIGGRVAMVGGRLIQSVASSLADRFFAAFAQSVGDGGEIRRLAQPEPAMPLAARAAIPVVSASAMPVAAVPLSSALIFAAGICVGIVATVAALVALSVAL